MNGARCRFFSKISRRSLIVLIALILSVNADAVPSFGYVKLSTVGGRQNRQNGWAVLNVNLRNPDKAPAVVELRVRPARYSNTDFVVFNEKITVPAKSEFMYDTAIYLDGRLDFIIELFSNGRKIKSQKLKVTRCSNKTSLSIVLNDSDNSSFYLTRRISEFNDKVLTPLVSTSSMPETWLALKGLSSIIFVSPDYSKFNNLQYQAILDYVNQGGTVVFADPFGVIEAEKTPLISLLPVTPVRIGKVSKLSALNHLVPGSASKLRIGTPILESYPKGDGVSILGDNDKPIIRWKRYGLGSSRFIAFPINKGTIKDDAFAAKLIRLLVPMKGRGKRVTAFSYEGFQHYLDSITGVKIPSIETIQLLLVIYLILLVLVIFICTKMKKEKSLWLVASVIAILSTVILIYKSTVSGLHSPVIISEIKTTVVGPDSSTSDSLLSAFSSKEIGFKVCANSTDSSFLSFPKDIIPVISTIKGRNSNARIAKGFMVSRIDGYSCLSNLKLKPNTPQLFQFLSSEYKYNFDSYPVLTIGDNIYKFRPWSIPGEINTDDVMLVLPSKVIPLTKNGANLVLSDHYKKRSLDDTKLLTNLLEHNREAIPYVAIFSGINGNNFSLDDCCKLLGKEFRIIPVQLDIKENRFVLNNDLVFLEALGNTAKKVLGVSGTSENIEFNPHVRGHIKVSFPSILSQINPDSVEITFDYISSDSNVEVVPVLSYNMKKIRGTKKGNKTFVFKKEQLNRVCDSVTHSFAITFEERLNNGNRRDFKKRVFWTPKEFSVKIMSRLPNGMIPLKY